jgi:hypothetical protein
MSRKTHHVVPAPQGGWNIKKGGSTRASKHFDRKQDAIDRGREISRNQSSELVIHRKDGTIARKDSFVHDPHAPRDRDR